MPKIPGEGMGLWAKVGFYSSLGLILPGGAVAGFGLGWLLDRWLHTSPTFSLILGLAGAAAGLIDILRVLTRAEKQDDADERSSGHGPS